MDENCHVEPLQKTATPEEQQATTSALLAVGGMGCPNCAARVRNGCKSQIARQWLTKGSHPATVGIRFRKPTLARRLPTWKLTKKPTC